MPDQTENASERPNQPGGTPGPHERLRALLSQHSFDEACFHCASDQELLRGVRLMDAGQPWDGRKIHMQVPPEFCPHFGYTGDEANEENPDA